MFAILFWTFMTAGLVIAALGQRSIYRLVFGRETGSDDAADHWDASSRD